MLRTVTCPKCGNTCFVSGSDGEMICPHCKCRFVHKDWFGTLSSWSVGSLILLCFITFVIPEEAYDLWFPFAIICFFACSIIGIIKAFSD